MNELDRRLVEVEYILKKLDDEYISKIPQEIWDYIEDNKNKEYIFDFDESKELIDQQLNVDTIAILTYINMEYLLDTEQRKEMEELLRKDYIIAEEEKKKKYNPEDIFHNRAKLNLSEENNLCEENNLPIEVKIEKWYDKIFVFLKKIFKE